MLLRAEIRGRALLHHVSNRWSFQNIYKRTNTIKFITVMDETCFCHLPTELRAQKTPGKDFITLTCNTSCPEADPHTAFRWYWNREAYGHCENQDITVFGPSFQRYRCAVKGHEDLRSEEACEHKDH